MLIKKLFTNAKKSGKNMDRVQSSKYSGQTAPKDFADFFISEIVGSVANILNMPTSLYSGFELPTPCGSRDIFQRGNTDMTNEITTYNFNLLPIRTQNINGQPWFCLADCMNGLNLKNKSTKIRLDEKGVCKTYTLTNGGQQEVIFINEPNLYRLIFRSNKPQAQAFADWVYNEVLPSIRKTGSYNSPAVPQVDMKAIGGMVKKCCAVAVRDELKTILLGDKIDMGEVVNWNDIMCRALALRADNIVKSQYTALINENAVLKEKINNIKRLAN